jgi:gluconolactonase
MKFEVLAEHLAFPEGPVVMPDGSVIFVEIAGQCLSRFWNGRKEVIARIPGGPAGAAIGPDGAMYICNIGGIDLATFTCLSGPGNEGSIERVNLSTGKVERVYERAGDRMLSGPDDLVFDRAGNMWFTDLGKELGTSHSYGGLYYCSPDGNLIEEVFWPGYSYNGIGLSPDETSLYVADTITSRLWQLQISRPGAIVRGPYRQPGKLLATIGLGGTVDSLAVTAAGNVCTATCIPGGIAVVAPDGSVTHQPMPDDYVTNIAFGGADMCDAYITFSGTGRLVKMRWPEPGHKLNFGGH